MQAHNPSFKRGCRKGAAAPIHYVNAPRYLLLLRLGNFLAYSGTGVSCGNRASATGSPGTIFNGMTPARHLSA